MRWQDLKDLFKGEFDPIRADVMMDGPHRSKGFGIVKFSTLDNLDTRHYMMSCFVYNYFKQKNVSLTNILEIGGGFGTWRYINEHIMKYNKWTIIDLDFVIKLQKRILS